MTTKEVDGCNLPSLAEIVAEHKNLEMLAWMLDRVLGPVEPRPENKGKEDEPCPPKAQ